MDGFFLIAYIVYYVWSACDMIASFDLKVLSLKWWMADSEKDKSRLNFISYIVYLTLTDEKIFLIDFC